MDGKRFDTIFEDFIYKLLLTKTQKERIDNAITAAEREFGDKDEVALQGSFATGTTVKPLSESMSQDGIAGEYDVDIAIIDDAWPVMPSSALDEVKDRLREIYSDKVDRKTRESCERVNFANESTGVHFHVDYVPLQEENGVTNKANRSSELWTQSETIRIVRQYLEFDEQHSFATPCLLIIKRLRNYSGFSDDLPSIAIQATFMQYYEDQGSYLDDLIYMSEKVLGVIKNKYDPLIITADNGDELTEDLQYKINNRLQLAGLFAGFLDELKNIDINDLKKIAEYLSTDFPVNPNEYPPEMESLRREGLSYNTRSGVENIEIDSIEHEKSSFKKITNGMYFSKQLFFKLIAKNHRELNVTRRLACRWRITNDPLGAPKDDIRGKLLSRGSGNEFEIKEHAQYNGRHRAELFIFERNSPKVIGRGIYIVEKGEI